MDKKLQVRNRPKNLNLWTIRLPINAVVSILHRMSGMLLFLMLPFLLYAMYLSLKNEDSFNHLVLMMQHWFLKVVLIGFSWAFFHHFYAGLRHLGQDVHWMTSLQKARLSSRLVLCLVTLSVVIFAYEIW